jgi:PAS domain S-box-containing protein
LYDLTERKKAEEEKQFLLNRNKQTLESMLDGFMLIDSEGNIIDVNPAYCQMSGYSKEELLQFKIFDLEAVMSRVELEQSMGKLITLKALQLESKHRRKDGQLIDIEVSLSVMDFGNQPLIVAFFRNITERKINDLKINEYTEQLKNLTGHLLEVREDERKRIGREIHDDLGQQLTAVKMDVVWIDKKTAELGLNEKLPLQIKEKLKNVIHLLDESNQSIRRILSELRPSILDDYGLLDALQWHGSQFTKNTGIPVEISHTDFDIKLPEPVATCIYRVFQESLTNVSRYAGADKVKAHLTITKKTAEIIIEDNGIGFDISAINNLKSFGLLGMKERVSALNGIFDLKSTKGKGTRLKIKIPFF